MIIVILTNDEQPPTMLLGMADLVIKGGRIVKESN